MLKYSRQKNTLWTRISVALTIFVFLFGIRFFFGSSISFLTYEIGRPIWAFRDSIFGQTKDLTLYTQSKSSLISENTALKDEIYNLQLKNIELGNQLSAFTQSDLQSILTDQSGRVLAKVISKPPYSLFDTLVLDTSTSSVEVGDTVYIDQNILVGAITESKGSYAKAVLYSSGTNSTQADVLRTGQTVSLIGEGGGNFLIVLPKDFDIALGDNLVDMEGSQAIIAQVFSIDTSSQGSFKKVYARIPINIFQVEWVSIGSPLEIKP